MRSAKVLPALIVAIAASVLAPMAAAMPGWLTESSRFQPGSAEVTARLTRRIDRLLTLVEPSVTASPDGFIDRMSAADGRAEFFRMEAVLRLYEHKFPNLAGDLAGVKAIEDGLGAYEEFKDKAVLAAVLHRSTLRSQLTTLRSTIGHELRGWGTAQDTPYVKKEILRMLTRIRDEPYDFTRLEDGIHEYRRQLRWLPMTVDGLDGLIVVRDDAAGSCPAPALESLAGTRAAGHKYANPPLDHPAMRPCAISRCLMWQISKTIRDLGRLKDDAESHEAHGDDSFDHGPDAAASAAETARATALRHELNSSRTLDLLMSQISSCRSS